EAILRRSSKRSTEASAGFYEIGKYSFDVTKQLLTFNEQSRKLTTKESELLDLLCRHRNEVLERNFALRSIWIDDNYFNARSMDVYITKLRKYLNRDENVQILNIHGKGYKLLC
ncbi:MAG: response regulator transcription factor, partial [Bacteroidetes bacterium]